MSLFYQILHSEFTYCIGWTLIHSLWQGALVAAALRLASGSLREKSSEFRYLAACVAMALQLLFLVDTFVQISGSYVPHAPSSSFSISETVFSPPIAFIREPNTVRMSSSHAVPTGSWTQSLNDLWQVSFGLLDIAIPWIGCVWCCGFLAFSLLNLGGTLAVRRLKSLATRSVDVVVQTTFAKLLTRMQIGKRVRLLQSTIVQSPIVIGAINPVILFPTSLLSQLSLAQIEAVLVHELAHVRRHDYLVNLIQVAIETLLFYHPATWWISAQIRSERENCCDNLVIQVTEQRDIYVTALAVIAESRVMAPSASGAPLLPRIRRLLGIADQRQSLVVNISTLLILLGMIVCTERLIAQSSNTEARTRTLVVWKVDADLVGDRQAGVVPDELVNRAAAHHIQLQIKIFSDVGFSKLFADAKTNGTDPDILLCNDTSVVDALSSIKDKLLVNESLDGLGRGWKFIFPSSPHYIASKELALTYADDTTLKDKIDPALEKLVVDVSQACGEGNIQEATRLLDPSHRKDVQPDVNLGKGGSDQSVVLKKKICSVLAGRTYCGR